jgi:hypothetical protein
MRIAWVRELLRASALIVKKTGERAVETQVEERQKAAKGFCVLVYATLPCFLFLLGTTEVPCCHLNPSSNSKPVDCIDYTYL